ncbi:DNA/RNA polymerase, partial [Fistulina hepatica ATCC 64428]
RQRLLEESVYDVALARLEHQGKTMKALNLQPKLMGDQLQHWMWSWHCALRDKLREVLKDIEELEKATSLAARRNKQPSYFDSLLGPYLRLLKEDRLSLLTIMEVMRLNGTSGICGGMKTTRALVSVGKAVEMEYKSQMCQNNRIAIPVGVTGGTQGSGYFSYMGYRSLQERRVAACRMAEDSEGWTTDWTQVTRAKVGGVLVDCLISTARVVRQGVDKDGAPIEEEQEAFFHTYEYQCGMKLGVIKLNQIIADALASNSVGESIHPRHLPMLVPPKPWTDYRHGGYLHNKTFAMRFKDSREQESYLRRASAKGSLELVYASLDYLGRTPWVINKKVFDVVLKVWNSGIRLGKMPPAEYEEPEPEKPTVDLSAPLKALQQQERNYKLKYKSWQQAVAENHSNRCSVNYKIEIARAFLGDKMYFPHNLDFRGRAYPIPPHLNHIGDDLSRGLLKFHEKKPLGERGLRWLKVHLANLYGYDKASFSERVRFVEDSLDLIYDSATNPLDGKRWWMDASDPWQCLAVCMELRDALESPDPLTFESGQPVHQDGTCNGLQHYAALGGDNQGARQVNLSAADRPSDVYTHVGNMVEKIIDADAAKGDPIAVMLQGKITRKVVKQTVMTTVYGVTFVGAREQISKQLRDRKDIPEEDCWAASAYLAKLVLGCIGNLFSGAKDIMTWLSLSARLIAKSIPETRLAEALADFKVEKEKAMMTATSLARKPAVLPRGFLQKEFMTPVVWTTPMGLPIVQPYRKMTKRQIITPIQTVYLIDPNVTNGVNSTKQASAFPPNFIHSLDATHMMLTALRCNSANLTFASVHDSYWTHACDIDHMSEIIRDTFIALHSADVLERLRREFIIRYSKHKIPLIAFGKGTSIVKALVDAGSRLRVTRAQAESLKGLAPLLEISDDMPSTVDEADADLLRDAVDSMETNDSAADGDTSGSDPNLLGKFVNLADILPPLPKKGTFHVEEIKESPYFFS